MVCLIFILLLYACIYLTALGHLAPLHMDFVSYVLFSVIQGTKLTSVESTMVRAFASMVLVAILFMTQRKLLRLQLREDIDLTLLQMEKTQQCLAY